MTHVRRIARWSVATLVTSAMLYGLVVASSATVVRKRSAASRVRLSWSARPERIEVCRELSAAEIAEREEHMRQRVECDGRFATYRLSVEADGRSLHESVVRGAGLRHDRPLYLLREIDLAPGRHRLRVTFTRRETSGNEASAVARAAPAGADTGLFAGRAEREATERSRRARAAIPPRLLLDTVLTLGPERAIVVSFDPERKAFRVLSSMQR